MEELIYSDDEMTCYEQFLVDEMESGKTTVPNMLDFIVRRAVGYPTTEQRNALTTAISAGWLYSKLRGEVRKAIAQAIPPTRDACARINEETAHLVRAALAHTPPGCEEEPEGELILIDEEQ